MRISQPLPPLLLLVAAASPFLPTASAWGAAGHEIVATIAQIHLHPSVLPVICDLLGRTPSDHSEATLRRECHLAPIATWADRDKYKMRWSAALHYVGAVDDQPSTKCLFPGDQGWAGTKNINVLDGIKNVTSILGQWSGADEHAGQGALAAHKARTTTGLARANGKRFERRTIPGPREEEAFKFLVHFMGDMHQPLHLTGRDRGGNNQKVYFEHRQSSLHSAWDTGILTRLIRGVNRNYSRPLPDNGDLPIPSRQIELSLRHTIYDALIRRVMWEGVESKWIDELDEWLQCPAIAPTPEPTAATPERQGVLSLVTSAFMDPISFSTSILRSLSLREKVEINPDGPLVCPYAWAVPLHQLNCQYVWPPAFNLTSPEWEESVTGGRRPPVHNWPTLDTPEYMAALDKDYVMEKLVAQGGLRLAGILNWLFATEE